jgi:hypothetical protein
MNQNMNRLLSVPLFTLLCGVMLARSSTQVPPNPCTAAQQKQLDFWVGDWNATWPGQNGGPAGHGTNSIMRVLDGCVVQESFVGQGTPPFRGTSLSIFDVKAGKWKRHGSTIKARISTSSANLDGQMVTCGAEWREVLQRMVWKNIAANDFD